MTTNQTAENQSRLKVILIANTAWYLRNFRNRLVERLESRGFQVVLASPVDAIIKDNFFMKRQFVPLNFSRRGRNPVTELLTVIKFLRALRQVRPDIVLTWTPKPNIYGGLAASLLGLPFIPNVSGLGAVFIRGGFLSKLVGRLYRFAFSRAPIIYFQNEEDRKRFIKAGWVRAEVTERLPGSGVDLEQFKINPLPAREPFVFLYCGRLLADKGLRELIQAADHLLTTGRSFILRLAGFLDPGNPGWITRQELENWVLTRKVEYLGAMDDIRPVLSEANCVVLPSYGEGVPRTLLEAAAMGRPLITTNVPGCRDAVLPGVSGFLCRPRDVNSLAECMSRMLDLTAERLTEMGQAGRKYMEDNFSEEIILDAYLCRCLALKNIKPIARTSQPD